METPETKGNKSTTANLENEEPVNMVCLNFRVGCRRLLQAAESVGSH